MKTLEHWSKVLETEVIDLKCEACDSVLSLSIIKDLVGWRLFCRHCTKTPVVSHGDLNKVITAYFNSETQKRFEEMYSIKGDVRVQKRKEEVADI